MQAVNDESLDAEKKLEIFNKSFKTMSDVTFDLIADSVVAIKTPDAVVEEVSFIKEFLHNADSSIYQKIQEHIASMKDKSGIQPITVSATPDQIALGAPASYQIPIKLDNADFFGRGS